MAGADKEQSLRAWISSAGGFIHPDLSLFAADTVKGRKVVAQKDLAKGSLLIKVPTSICLSGSPTRSSRPAATGEGETSLGDVLASQRKLTPFLRLVLQVLHEYSKGADSAIAPFLDSLPTTHNCVLGWSTLEKSALSGTTLEAQAATDIKSTFETLILPVLRSRPEAWQGEWTSFEAFQRVCGVVQSRTFHLQEDNWLTGISTPGTELYMIPGIDMVNHSTDATQRNTSLHRREEKAQAVQPLNEEGLAKEDTLMEVAGKEDAPQEGAAKADAPQEGAAKEDAPQEGAAKEDAPQEGAAKEDPPKEGSAKEDAQKEGSAQDGSPKEVSAKGESSKGGSANGTVEAAGVSFFTMEADKDVASGQELLHSYGDLSDAELLNIFGFVDTLGADFTNPNNEVHLPTETLVALCQEQKSGRRLGKNFKRRKDFLKEVDMLPEGFPVSIKDPIPDSLVTVTQILLLSDQSEFDDLRLEIQKARKKGQSTDLLGKDTLDESEHSMFVCTNLLRTVEEQLAGFPSEATDVAGADPQRVALAAHVRAGEQDIVKRQKAELLQLMMSLTSDAEEEED